MNTLPINANVTWKEPAVVEKTAKVASVSVTTINVVSKDGKLTLLTPYQWLGEDGKEVRRGVNVLAEDTLQKALGGQFATVKTALLALVDSKMKNPIASIRFEKDGTLGAIVGKDGKPTAIKEPALDAELQKNGLNVATVKQLVQNIGTSIVAG